MKYTPKEQAAIVRELEERRDYGGRLSNIIFNLLQTQALSDTEKRSIRPVLAKWDGIERAQPRPAKPRRKA